MDDKQVKRNIMALDDRSALGLNTIVKLVAHYEKTLGTKAGLALVSHLMHEVARIGVEKKAFTMNDVVVTLGFSGGIEEAERLSKDIDLSTQEAEEIMEVWDEERKLGNL